MRKVGVVVSSPDAGSVGLTAISKVSPSHTMSM